MDIGLRRFSGSGAREHGPDQAVRLTAARLRICLDRKGLSGRPETVSIFAT
jgi:hypothetical protein